MAKLRHRPIQQDIVSHLVANHTIEANKTAGTKVAIQRLELHLGHPSGVRLEPTHMHALGAVRRRQPTFLLPLHPADIVNRTAELETLRQCVLPRYVVDLYGPDGAGKTELVANLAQVLDLNSFPDGAIYVSGRLKAQDLLQVLFDSFYESDIRVKIAPDQTHSYLQNLRVLVIFDDVGLGPQKIDPILDALSEAAVLIVGPERTALGRGRAIHMKGLARQDAAQLFKMALAGTLSVDESLVIDQICLLLNDMPLSISCIAAQAAHSKRPLTKLLNDLQAHKPWAGPGADLSIGPTLEQIVLQLDGVERELLTLIAAFSGPTVSSTALIDSTGLSENEFQERIIRLQRLGLLYVVGSNRRVAMPHAIGKQASRLALKSAFHPTVSAWLVDEGKKLQVVNYYTARLGRGDSLPGDELSSLLGSIEYCARHGWLDHLKPMARAADRTLAELGWWAEWQHLLDVTRRTAQAEGDRALETWAMHQLGSVLGTLGVFERSFHLLRAAVSMRQAQGDKTGEALTLHNLQLLESLLPEPMDQTAIQRPSSVAVREAVEETSSAEQAKGILPDATEPVRRTRRFRLRLALLATLAVLIIGTLSLRFVAGVGPESGQTPKLNVSWEFGDAWNTLDNETWAQQIRIVVENGADNYLYFVNDEPTEQMFELVLPVCDGAEGIIRVEADSGLSGEVDFAFDSPYCE